MNKLVPLLAMLALLVPAFAHATGTVAEAKLGKNVVDRQVTDETTTFVVGEKAFLWLRMEGAAGETLTVTWKVNDQAYPATLSIGGDPWRTWANKTLHVAGDWTVTVSDSAGTTLNETKLTVK